MNSPLSARSLLFLLDTSTSAARWSEFMAYFVRRGYPCYTAGWPLGELPSSGGYLLAAGATAARIAHPWAQQKVAGLVLFAPPLTTLLRLGREGDAPPIWVGYGAQQPSARLTIWLRRRLPVAPYVFQGLDADLPFRPGWERVAYTVRLWLEWQEAEKQTRKQVGK